MRKLIILVFLLILVTGCEVKSNITINKDLTVVEEVSMGGTETFFKNHYMSLPLTVINKMIETDSNRELLDQNGYSHSINKEGKYPVYVAKKTYNSITDYTANTIFKSHYFNKFESSVNGNVITINAKDFISNGSVDDEDRYYISDCTYSINLPFVVTDSNADKIDKKTNTYYWYINDETANKEFKLTFDTSKVYVYNLIMYISIGILALIVLVIVIIFVKHIYYNKKNNSF